MLVLEFLRYNNLFIMHKCSMKWGLYMKKLSLLLVTVVISIFYLCSISFGCDNPEMVLTNTNIDISKKGNGSIKSTLTFDDHSYNISYDKIVQLEYAFKHNDISKLTKLYIYTSKKDECTCTNIELVLKFNSINDINSKIQKVFESIGCDYSAKFFIENDEFNCSFAGIDSINFAIDSILLSSIPIDYVTKDPIYTIKYDSTTVAYSLNDIINNSNNAKLEDHNQYIIKIKNKKDALKSSNTNDKKTSISDKNKVINTKKQSKTTNKDDIITLTKIKDDDIPLSNDIVKTTPSRSTNTGNIQIKTNETTNKSSIEDYQTLLILLFIILMCLAFMTGFLINRKKNLSY